MNIMEELCELKEVIYVLSNQSVLEIPVPGVGEACLIGCPGLGILVVYLMGDGTFEHGFAPMEAIPSVRADLLQSPFIPYLRKVEPREWFTRVDFAQFEDYSKFYDRNVVETIIGFFLESVRDAIGNQTPPVQ